MRYAPGESQLTTRAGTKKGGNVDSEIFV